MRSADFEARVLRFERDWQRGSPRALAHYVDEPPLLDPAERHRVLVELVCVDLEYRRRRPHARGTRALESYAAELPELGPFDRLSGTLVAEEYRCRRRWGDRPSHDDVLARFPERRSELGALLAEVDAELAAEPAEAPAVPPAGPDFVAFSHHDFLIQRMIGAGRTGKVYQALHRGSGRVYALKFLRKSSLRDPRLVARFLAEARTVAGLRHPNIVATEGLGRAAGGAYFIVMERVEGPDLAEVVRRGPLEAAKAARRAVEMCHALAHAHAAGVIHCDLKPANILLDGAGAVRVADFGLARHLTRDSPWAAAVEGTAPFMAPEQAVGAAGAIDPRTDVYGLGAVLYALLTGQAPWTGRSVPEILARVIGDAPVVPPIRIRPDLAPAINDVCERCLAKPPRDRFGTIDDVRTALLRALG